MSLGCSSFESSDAEVTAGENAAGDFEATVVRDYATYVVRIPAGTPSRGQVLFGDSLDNLQVMANLGCYL